MSKVRVLKKNDKAYIELPQEAVCYDELELFQLKEGYYLLSVPLGENGARASTNVNQSITPANSTINENEKAVLKKLISIKFEKRVPPYVNQVFSEAEMATLSQLEKKKLINIFKSKKYMDGVYNISDSIYPLITGKPSPQKPEQRSQSTQQSYQQSSKQQISAQKQTSSQTPSRHSSKSGPVSVLNSNGFVILNSKNEAFDISQILIKEMKSGAVIGVKGFDGKFYLVTADYLEKARAAIVSVLKTAMGWKEISESANLDPDGCMAILRILSENGDIIEKKKGVFAQI
ncbi:hypothetical protein KKF81_01970 [Candidatus Micrarchaeota archaeon]|nr:hypothetical protein [Candidatus Micrarchaeota archaeon]MBU1165687.1 hypothetical protein [Candidatus Micrarchaeota archaeon]MBU1886460.1 hypothetical protein [Candidatus Micrarchaeota archaeon]